MKNLPCFNVKTHYSILDGVIGTPKEVQTACAIAGIEEFYIADTLNAFGWQETLNAQGIGLRVYDDANMEKKGAPYYEVSLYSTEPYSTANMLFDFYNKEVSSHLVHNSQQKKWHRVSVDALIEVLRKLSNKVYAVCLYEHAYRMNIHEFVNVFFEFSWRDLQARKKSLFCQANQTALPEQYFIYEILTKFKQNDIPYIVPLDVLNFHAKLRGYGSGLKDQPDVHGVSKAVKKLPEAEIPKALVTYTKKELLARLTNRAYQDRLRYEWKILQDKNFLNYIFLVADIVNEARAAGVIVGAGRGSSCGSLLCYMLGITRIDPIKYGLLFERFIDVNRNDMPDIDIDFDDREAVIDLLRRRYTHVSKMGTVLTIKYKKAIDIVGSILGISEQQLAIAKNEVVVLDDDTDILENIKSLKKYPAMRYVHEIYERAQNIGTHASGVLVASKPLHNYVAIDASSGSAQISKAFIERRGLIKIDVLGLINLSVIKQTLEMVGITYADFEKKIFEIIDTDHSVWDIFRNNSFLGVFQAEGYSVRKIILRLQNKGIKMTFALMSIITAISRVGGWISGAALQIADDIIKFSSTKRARTLPVLRETYGRVVYQEQIMKVCEIVGKFTTEEVTAIRKAIAKKTGGLEKYEAKFLENGLAQGYPAHELWNDMKSAGSYAFNKSHAVAYSVTTYMTAYLKKHYPKEFYCAMLTAAKTGDRVAEERALIIAESGLKIGKPSLEEIWTLKDGKLIPPITAVKGIGPKRLDGIRKRGKLTEAEKDLASRGIDIKTIPQKIFKNYPTLPQAFPIYTQEPFHFMVTGAILDKNLTHVNSPTNIERTGVTQNTIGIGGAGNILNFTIFTGVHIYKIKTRWDRTSAAMLETYHTLEKGDLIDCFLEAYEFGFTLIEYRKGEK